MRILHVSSLYKPDIVGGAEIFVEELSRELIKLGHEVGVACLSRSPEAPEKLDGVTVYRLGRGPVLFPMDWGQASKIERAAYKITTQMGWSVLDRLEAALDDFRPDVVNTHSLSELSPRIWATIAQKCSPIAHTLHDYAGLCTNSAMFRNGRDCGSQHLKCRAWGTLHYHESAKVKAVVGVGKEILARHRQSGHFMHVRDDLAQVIWNAVVQPGPPAPRAVHERGVVTFGYLGRVEAAKGADLLLNACRQLPSEGWRLIMAGKAVEGEASYKALAEGLPVDLVGFVERDRFFSEVDCLIAPPLWPEAFGRTIAEGFIRGVPVLGADIAGVREQIEASGAGWLFKTGDATDLARRMREIIVNPQHLHVPTEAISRFAERVSPEGIARQYSRLYEALLER